LTASTLPEDSASLSKTEVRDLENRAKEDARYLLPLACSTQMGMTLNARNLEHLLWELSDHPLSEVRELGQAIHAAVGKMAPSLVKYTSRGEFPRANRLALETQLSPKRPLTEYQLTFRNAPRVELIDFDADAEQRVLNAFSFSAARDRTKVDEQKLWRTIFANLSAHDPVYREFEVARATMLLEMSASCYAQFKRHRLMTQLVQPYSPDFAAIVPPAIEEIGQGEVFRSAVREASDVAQEIGRTHSGLESYVLTNAHVKRLMVVLNARELYHLCRLRCDAHAQWEIQIMAGKMLELVKPKWPNLLALACGKDKFEETMQEYLG